MTNTMMVKIKNTKSNTYNFNSMKFYNEVQDELCSFVFVKK